MTSEKKEGHKMNILDAPFPEDPFSVFTNWLKDAEKNELNDPNAMCLATVDAAGKPSARIMLLKGVDERGFIFFTNGQSRKGQELAATKTAALCLHWKSLHRQVRVEGQVEILPAPESDAYFATRPRESQIGAWASRQSENMDSRDTFDAAYKKFETQFDGQETIPRPPHWGGYIVCPHYIEFWQDQKFRLHHRLVYCRDDKTTPWTTQILYP